MERKNFTQRMQELNVQYGIPLDVISSLLWEARNDEREFTIRTLKPRIKRVIEEWKHSPFKFPEQAWEGWGEDDFGPRHYLGIKEVLEQELEYED